MKDVVFPACVFMSAVVLCHDTSLCFYSKLVSPEAQQSRS